MPSKAGENASALARSINTATRSVHTKLNKLIVHRLPLALPPQSDDASQYVVGLLHIAPIYIGFESLWRDILDSPAPAGFTIESDRHVCAACDPTGEVHRPAAPSPPEVAHAESGSGSGSGSVDLDLDADADAALLHKQRPPKPAVVCSRMQSLLGHVHVEGLQRAPALRRDLAALTGWSGRTLAEHLDDAAESAPALAAFLAHTRRAVARRPHALLAYAWVLYMALFSGGRFIRASLEAVDPRFWVPASASAAPAAAAKVVHPQRDHLPPKQQQQQQQRPISPPMSPPGPSGGNGNGNGNGYDGSHNQTAAAATNAAPLDFFRFATPSDGEDLKQAFKARLAESETLLSEAERGEVVDEARCIFDFMVRVVGELDAVCADGSGGAEDEAMEGDRDGSAAAAGS
ncbi:hypothetical protein GGR56DRAFT_681840 [Xylariaceae sp. FL0804]|nr:hypothetical protein GGR56DRAFT_681840 [Xylariaceae sp. FL0804]